MRTGTIHPRRASHQISDDSDSDEHRDNPSKKSVARVKWSEVEVRELKKYFQHHLDTKVTPRKRECLAAVKKSKIRGGMLHRRAYPLIVKKDFQHEQEVKYCCS